MKSIIMSTKIEERFINQLTPNPRNPRTHSDHQVAQIAASIAEYGFTNPVLIDRADVIIAGHARVLAARKLDWDRVPVIVLGHLTEIQRRAYVIADNKLAMNAEWDFELLRQEVAATEAELRKLDVFTDQEYEELLAELEQETNAIDEDDAPELPLRPVTVTGDLWLLPPDHRCLCADSTVMKNIETVMAGSAADMVFMDMPYNVAYRQSSKTSGRKRERPIVNDNLGKDFGQFLYNACVNVMAVAKGAIYICMSSSELHTLHKAFTDAGGHWSTFLIWSKNTFTLGHSDYQRQFEPILYGWPQGKPHYFCPARDQGDVWFVNKPRVNDLHPTMKPVELVERAIRNSSHCRDQVLDPFGGAGSTLIACEKTGRRARLIEIEPQYVDVMVERWQTFTGRQATLEGDGRTFAEVARERLVAGADASVTDGVSDETRIP